MRLLLAFAAATEALTGVALMALPSGVARLLFGAEFVGPGVAAGRVAGVALVALGVACGTARGSRGAGLAMLLYTLPVAGYFAWIGVQGELVGVLLWPAAAYHALIGVALGAVMYRARQHAG